MRVRNRIVSAITVTTGMTAMMRDAWDAEVSLDAARLEKEIDRHAEQPAHRQGEQVFLPQARRGVEAAQETG